MILAYKAFNPDMTCRDFQYKCGRWYEQDEPAILCRQGFHACILPQHVFKYYNIFTSKFAKVLLDDIDFGIRPSGLLSDSKICGSKIYIFPHTLTYGEMVEENANVFNILLRLKGFSGGTANYLVRYFDEQNRYLDSNDVSEFTYGLWSGYVSDLLLNKSDDDFVVIKDLLKRIEEEQRKAGMF